MARSLCPDRPRAGLAILAALVTLVLPSWLGQVGAILLSGALGWWLLEPPLPPAAQQLSFRVSPRAGIVALAVFVLLLLGLPLWSATANSPLVSLVDGFYRAGALVFGGGHVVLPLLQSTVVPAGAVSEGDFLAGYGAAQAVPGPLFTFAAYLGAVMRGPLAGWASGLVFLLVIFLPGFLLVVGALPFWDELRARKAVQKAMAGINAGVVGILLSALYDPLWTGAIHSSADFGIALASFGLLVYGRLSPVIVVALAAVAGWALSR